MRIQRKAHMYIIHLFKSVFPTCVSAHIVSIKMLYTVYMFIHLKLGFQTPEAVDVGRRDFCRRWTDSRKRHTLIPPRMTTPEIRALVTGFICLEGLPDSGGWKDEEKQKIETDMFFDVALT